MSLRKPAAAPAQPYRGPGSGGRIADTDPSAVLSMHQPWASLLVWGIKRIEGRSWPTQHRGRLWIHATSHQPSDAEIQELEAFYTRVHQLDGRLPIFPQSYPTSALLGCIDVVDCLEAGEVENWEGLPDGLKMEVGSAQAWLCQNPKRLLLPQAMRGYQRIWTLPRARLDPLSKGLKEPPGLIPFSWADMPPRSPAQPDQKKTWRRTVLEKPPPCVTHGASYSSLASPGSEDGRLLQGGTHRRSTAHTETGFQQRDVSRSGDDTSDEAVAAARAAAATALRGCSYAAAAAAAGDANVGSTADVGLQAGGSWLQPSNTAAVAVATMAPGEAAAEAAAARNAATAAAVDTDVQAGRSWLRPSSADAAPAAVAGSGGAPASTSNSNTDAPPPAKRQHSSWAAMAAAAPAHGDDGVRRRP